MEVLTVIDVPACVRVYNCVSEREREQQREVEGANKHVGVYWESVGLHHTPV